MALGLRPQGGGKTPAPLTRRSLATHIFPHAPLPRHSHLPSGRWHFCFFSPKTFTLLRLQPFSVLGFTVPAIFSGSFALAAVQARKTTQRHSPATRATRAPHPPSVPLTRCPRQSAPSAPLKRHTHHSPAADAPPWDGLKMVFRWVGRKRLAKQEVGKGGRGPRRSPGKRDDFLCEFLCGKAFF